jgi:hypothetical protein
MNLAGAVKNSRLDVPFNIRPSLERKRTSEHNDEEELLFNMSELDL